MSNSKFKFKASFSCRILKATAGIDKFVVMAGLDRIKGLIPKNIDLEKNLDIMAVAGNAAVGNRMNLNHDAVSNATLADIAPSFVWKLVDLDHNRNRVIGVIANVGFSKFGSDTPVTADEVKVSTEPINLSLAMLIYKAAAGEKLVNLLAECADETSEHYGKLSLSWELLFTDYDVAVGPTRNVSEAKIVHDPIERAKLDALLPQNDGSGKTTDGEYVYRIIRHEKEDDILVPTGVGIVEHPAAEVKGITIIEPGKPAVKMQANQLEVPVLDNVTEKSVITSTRVMEITSLDQINDANLKEATASSVNKLIVDKIREASEKWATERQEKENAVIEAKKRHEALQVSHDELKKVLDTANEKIKTLTDAAETREAEDKFHSRMSELDELYKDRMTDKVRAAVAKRVKGMSDEAYASYKEELAIFIPEKTSTETGKQTIASAIDKGSKEGNGQPVKGAETGKYTWREKWANALSSENVVLKGKRN